MYRWTNWKAWLVHFSAVSVILSNPVGPFTTCLECVTGADWEFSHLQHNRKIRFRVLAQRRLVFIAEAIAPALLMIVIETRAL